MSTGTALVPIRRSTTEALRQDFAQLLVELLEMRQQAGYWKAPFQRGKEREAKLERRIEELEAKVKQLEHQLFGRPSEKKNRPETSSSSSGGKRPRGQQVRQSRTEAAEPRASAAGRGIPRAARRSKAMSAVRPANDSREALIKAIAD